MRMPLILTLLLVAGVGTLVALNAGCDTKTPAPPPAATTPASTPPATGDTPPAATDEAAADGGAEQSPDEPIPATPDTPAQPPGGQPPATVTFDHAGPGELLAGSGKGYLDRTVWAPGICFPIADHAYANSQVWNPGGGKGPAGSQCAPANYSLPWHDTFCEARSRDNPFCVGGTGHQGQDIRAQSCVKNTWWTVAAEDGRITNVGTYSITLTADAAPHRQYRYLHIQMDALAVHEGTKVKKGDHIGKVSNYFGGTPTTIHLHFEIRAGVTGTTTDGKHVAVLAFLPPYLSLAEAYQRKLNGVACQ
ncbi:MAG: Peptidase [Caulobacter sp.]|nr:Peptidase [Caulobacter sp.]